MPSFFYHIAIDLYKDRLFDGKNAYPTRGSSKRPNPTLREPFEVFTQSPHAQLVDRVTVTSLRARTSPEEGSDRVGTDSPTKRTLQAPEEQDYRHGKIITSGITMALAATPNTAELSQKDDHVITKSIRNTGSGLATKGRYEALEDPENDLGWGIVRLYRDGHDTPGLYDDTSNGRTPKHTQNSSSEGRPTFKNEDCTTLCILAVPSYLTPSDFLGFVGEKTREKVSHFRMIRTEKSNRYMVLMKFRNGKEARIWRKEWNGRSFDGVQVRSLVSSQKEPY